MRAAGESHMLSGLLGRKVGMTQVFGANGSAVPVTVIEAGPCTITQVKTATTDGYEAVQLGFGAAKLKNTTRPILGHLGHSLPQTPSQRRRQQQTQAKARQEARKKAAKADEGAAATETEADEAEATEATGAKTARSVSAKRRRGASQALGPFAVLREGKLVGDDSVAVGPTGDTAKVQLGERVDVLGTSKGKGFAGVMKRHGFHGGARTPRQSDHAPPPRPLPPPPPPPPLYKAPPMAR